jgi:tetratricopeptide (TPR) repeat protein
MSAYRQALLDAAYAAYRNGDYGRARGTLGLVVGSGWRELLALRFMARVEEQLGNLSATATWLQAASEIDPDNATVHSDLGDALRKLGDLDVAIRAYRRAIERDPGLTSAYGGMVHALHLSARDAEALTCAKALLRRAPTVDAHRIAGTTLVWLNRHEEAIEHFRAAQVLSPDDATARYHEGMALLALGEFDAGWRLYEARRDEGAANPAGRELTQSLRQDGSDIRGKTVLLHAEQGLGDAIQFIRYAPLLAQRGVVVWLVVAPALKPLLSTIDGVAGVLAWDEPQPDAALHCSLMTLPLAFGTGSDSIPSQVPYLKASTERVETWRQRLGAGSRRRIGIAWSGNPTQPDDRLRSIPIVCLIQLLQRQDCEFHVVQTGLTAMDAARCTQLGVHDHSAELRDFSDTAALMEALDLIVSVDSAPAHLAGALARPTWLLLQSNADWRWMRDRTDSPWYPTMRLFRQHKPGDWDSVIAAVEHALDQLVPALIGA